MRIIDGILNGAFWLCIIVVIIAFVHEYGHYLVAKLCGVKIEAFAIGIGPEIFGKTNKKTGTRWKLCSFPLGGYVKMFGQSDMPKEIDFDSMTEEEKKVSFEHKTPLQKIAISLAGPFANILLTFFVFFAIFLFYGRTKIEPIITDIAKSSSAEKYGLKKNDKILSINGKKIDDFNLIRKEILLYGCNEINFEIERVYKKNENKIYNIKVIPENIEIENENKKKEKKCLIGIGSDRVFNQKYKIGASIKESFSYTVTMVNDTTYGIIQLITGKRSLKELSGPLRIGKMSHQAAQRGFQTFLYFLAVISVGIGVMNLVPIPVLDGGHILMNLIAILIRRQVSQKIQLIIYQIGFGLIVLLMLTGLVNDFLFLIK